jgi:hypothetical protein
LTKIPKRLDAIVQKALAKSADDRFESVSAMKIALIVVREGRDLDMREIAWHETPPGR